MPIKLNEQEQERLERELRSYPSYLKPLFEHLLDNWSYNKDSYALTEDCLERKETTNAPSFVDIY